MIYVANRYEILHEIGRGYRCSLFKSKDMYNGQDVIVSIMDDDVNISKRFISNLIDESTVINEIDSPYILSINDVGIHELENGYKAYYTVSDYIEGNTLEELTVHHGLSLEETTFIFRQILSGLEVAHNYDIYHGYLRPNNIIIDEGYNVKICNLGIIKSNNSIFNNSINIISKDLTYLSPQQICLGYSDKSSDFFSLGIILFELIFNQYPFEIKEDKDEMLKIIDKGVNWRNFNTEDVPTKLIYIINKLLSRSNKYKTPKEVIIDLSEYMYGIDFIKEEFESNYEITNLEEGYTYRRRKTIRPIAIGGAITLGAILLLAII